MGFQGKSYRPELHYMRGAGPKWHEKNGVPLPAKPERRFEPIAMSWLIPAATAVLLAVLTAITLA
jgi:hypothetical protein